MSDLATQHDDGVFEPDEETLISALRNQDDIPILMDVVEEHVSASISQEIHLSQSLDGPNDGSLQSEVRVEPAEEKRAKEESNAGALSKELIAKTITDVLAKRLPALVEEVMQTLQTVSAKQKSDENE
ncbi:hypothetical protein HGG82_10455 [Marinomonas sp. M1K-6]|uniref:Uncharacterized protein n=1 Tax=Marinomonas profundi TaxID=2726122 RepID=A0A847QX10_9GAMM|nr:hypothetical protein [Marinomonas profundi]NLQ18048.1 hypothetical protein [Marinomonas profundi]UDV01769.1 hypothetical protein J8N69_09085 [Marinomonas profundi]